MLVSIVPYSFKLLQQSQDGATGYSNTGETIMVFAVTSSPTDLLLSLLFLITTSGMTQQQSDIAALLDSQYRQIMAIFNA